MSLVHVPMFALVIVAIDILAPMLATLVRFVRARRTMADTLFSGALPTRPTLAPVVTRRMSVAAFNATLAADSNRWPNAPHFDGLHVCVDGARMVKGAAYSQALLRDAARWVVGNPHHVNPATDAHTVPMSLHAASMHIHGISSNAWYRRALERDAMRWVAK